MKQIRLKHDLYLAKIERDREKDSMQKKWAIHEKAISKMGFSDTSPGIEIISVCTL